mmetsp:Transcript_3211/g.3478  ORF Transcript_3211/g.3478 Transcript_3211/m.3478 type:complete len:221 (-) Transcript_3211:1236-1898(-)
MVTKQSHLAPFTVVLPTTLQVQALLWPIVDEDEGFVPVMASMCLDQSCHERKMVLDTLTVQPGEWVKLEIDFEDNFVDCVVTTKETGVTVKNVAGNGCKEVLVKVSDDVQRVGNMELFVKGVSARNRRLATQETTIWTLLPGFEVKSTGTVIDSSLQNDDEGSGDEGLSPVVIFSITLISVIVLIVIIVSIIIFKRMHSKPDRQVHNRKVDLSLDSDENK